MKTQELLDKYGIGLPPCNAPCGAEVGEGWHPLLERLILDLLALGWDKDCQQVKEKFGGLRFYIGEGNDPIHDRICAAESESIKTCEVCGAPGTLSGRGWIRTRCDDHK